MVPKDYLIIELIFILNASSVGRFLIYANVTLRYSSDLNYITRILNCNYYPFV